MNCLIVDHHPVTSFGLSQIVKANFPDWQVAFAGTVAEAIDYVNNNTTNLVLLNLMLPDNTGLALLAHISQFSPNTLWSIVISDATDLETLRLCERFGAHGYVSQVHAFTSIPLAIKAVCAEKKYFEPSLVDRLATSKEHIKFTPRQRDIVDLLLIGYSNKKIACTLNLSSGTVKNYIFDLMRMTSVNSRLEMAMKIKDSGYCRSEPPPG